MSLYGLVSRFIRIWGWVGPLKVLHIDLYQRLLTPLCLCMLNFRTQTVGLCLFIAELRTELNSGQVNPFNQVSLAFQRVSGPGV